MAAQCMYPEIHVTLVGENGNAFNVMGKVVKALRKAGCQQDVIDQFRNEAMSGDYDHLLATCMRWVDVQ